MIPEIRPGQVWQVNAHNSYLSNLDGQRVGIVDLADKNGRPGVIIKYLDNIKLKTGRWYESTIVECCTLIGVSTDSDFIGKEGEDYYIDPVLTDFLKKCMECKAAESLDAKRIIEQLERYEAAEPIDAKEKLNEFFDMLRKRHRAIINPNNPLQPPTKKVNDMKNFEIVTTTYIRGEDAENMSDDEIQDVLDKIDREIKRRNESVSTKPNNRRIQQLYDDMDNIITYLDGRNEGENEAGESE